MKKDGKKGKLSTPLSHLHILNGEKIPKKISVIFLFASHIFQQFPNNTKYKLSFHKFIKVVLFLILFSSFTEFLHSSVRYIEVSRTQLQSVEDETFQGLRLETLKLIDNKLQEIADRSFR